MLCCVVNIYMLSVVCVNHFDTNDINTIHTYINNNIGDALVLTDYRINLPSKPKIY